MVTLSPLPLGHEDEEEEEEDDIEPPPEGVDMAMVLAEECMESYVFDLQSFDACILTDEGSGFKISRGGVVKVRENNFGTVPGLFLYVMNPNHSFLRQ